MMKNRAQLRAEMDVLREKAREEALMKDPSKKEMHHIMIKTKSQMAYDTFCRPAYAYTPICLDPDMRG